MSVLYNYQRADGTVVNNPFETNADGSVTDNKYMGRADGYDGAIATYATPNQQTPQWNGTGGNFDGNPYPAGWDQGTGTPAAAAPAPPPPPPAQPYKGIVGGAALGGSPNTGAPAPAPATPAPLPGGTNGGIVGSASQFNSYSTPATLGAATPWGITDDQTVAGQIAKLTNENSPIMQQARAQAAKDAVARGLGNSSMAATGAADAVYRAATPIATADAATYAKAAGYNADQQNQNNQLQYTGGNQVGMSREQNATALQQSQIGANTSLQTAQISADTQKYTAQLNSQTQQVIATLNNDAQRVLNQEHDKNAAILQTSSAASNAFNQYATQMQNIQLSTTMDAAAKTQALKNARETYVFAMQAAYKLSSAQLPDFSSLLDFDALAGGVTGGSNAPAPPPTPGSPGPTSDYGTGNGGA